MSLPANESFTAVDGTHLGTMTGWTNTPGTGAMDISSSAVAGDASGFDLCVWTGDSFNNDQYSQAQVVSTGGEVIGVAVRGSASAVYCYSYVASNSYRSLYKEVNNSYTEILSYWSGGVSLNDVMRLEISGTTLTCKLNGSADPQIGEQTDNSVVLGNAGVCSESDGIGTLLDNWQGGNLGEGGGYSFTANNLITNSPVLGKPLFNKNQDLIANNSIIGLPYFGYPNFAVVTFTYSYCAVALSAVDDPQGNTNHVLSYRYGKLPVDSTDMVNITVQLRQDYVDENTLGTLIGEWEHADVSGVITRADQTLTGAQADGISNYGALFARIVSRVSG